MDLSEKDCVSFRAYLARSNLTEKTHQFSGLAWALKQEREGHVVSVPTRNPNSIHESGKDSVKGKGTVIVRGGLLADEMGLGKTIQMIATIICNPLARTLIVLPRALVEQWWKAIYDTTGHDAFVFHGSGRFEYDIDEISKFPIVITTYGLE